MGVSASAFAARAIVVLLLAAWSVPVSADELTYVLEPRAQRLVSEMFERMRPALRFTDGAIARDVVTARLCRGPADDAPCFNVRLEHPSPACERTTWGPFCVRFLDGAPPPDVKTVIAEALRASAGASVWTTLAQPAAPETQPPPPRLPPGALRTSLGLTLVPLGAGLILGGGIRRLVGRRWSGVWLAIAAVGIAALGALAIDARVQLVGAWDAMYVGAAAGLGVLVALHRGFADARNLALLGASCVVGAITLEAATLRVLPPPPAFPVTAAPTLFLSELLRFAPGRTFSTTYAGLATCAALYGDDQSRVYDPATAYPATWQPRADAREHVLHLGDSMVYGWGAVRFTDRLNELEPGVEHVNAAIAGTGPDVYLALLRRFLAHAELTAVVMYLTPNDYGDVDERRYPCSAWEPLLAFDASGTRLRYATARTPREDDMRFAWLLQNSPPPYVLRATLGCSATAAHLAAAFVHAGRRLGHMYGDEDAGVREAHLAAIFRDASDELRARHIPFVVVIFRDRNAVETGTPTHDGWDDKLKRIASAAGVVTVDTWEPLVAAVRRGEDVYLSPRDPHFNAHGHALIATWLHQELPAALAPAGRDAHRAPRT